MNTVPKPVSLGQAIFKKPAKLVSFVTLAHFRYHFSVAPHDWATHNADAIEKEVLQKVRDGDMILPHDMSGSSVGASLAIIDALQDQGCRFVTASELAEARGVSLAPGAKYACFAPWLHIPAGTCPAAMHVLPRAGKAVTGGMLWKLSKFYSHLFYLWPRCL